MDFTLKAIDVNLDKLFERRDISLEVSKLFYNKYINYLRLATQAITDEDRLKYLFFAQEMISIYNEFDTAMQVYNEEMEEKKKSMNNFK